MKRHASIHLSAIIVSLIIILLTVGLTAIFPPYRSAVQIWKGYYTLLLEKDTDYDALLSAAGWEAVVSESSQEVIFSTFDKVVLRDLQQITESHDPEDPRLDRYIKTLPRYFQRDDGRETLFIPSRRAVLPFALQIRRVLSGRDWKLADANFANSGLALLLSMIFVAGLLLLKNWRRSAVWIIAAYLPWVPAILLGGSLDLGSFFLLFSGWYLLFEEGRSHLANTLIYRYRDPDIRHLGGTFLYLGSAVAMTAAFRLPLDHPVRELIFLLLPLTADFCIFLLWGLVRLFVQYHVNHHPVFLPVPLRKEKQDTLRKQYLFLVILPVVLAPAFSRIKAPVHQTEVPVPVFYSQGYDWDTLRRLWQGSELRTLPNLADYLAHAAYQSGLSYGVEYHLPQPGEEVEIPVFTDESGKDRITKSKNVVMRFDDAWLAEQLARPAPGSVPKMILDQRGASHIETAPLTRAVRVLPWWQNLIVIFFAFFVLIGFDIVVTPVLSYVGKFQNSRKNRRAA